MSKFQAYINQLRKGDQVYVAGVWYTVNKPPTADVVPVKDGLNAVWMVDKAKIRGVKFRRPAGEHVHWDYS